LIIKYLDFVIVRRGWEGIFLFIWVGKRRYIWSWWWVCGVRSVDKWWIYVWIWWEKGAQKRQKSHNLIFLQLKRTRPCISKLAHTHVMWENLQASNLISHHLSNAAKSITKESTRYSYYQIWHTKFSNFSL